MDNGTNLGKIFTTEPMAMRALAAELRFAPTVTQQVFESVFQIRIGSLNRISCEVSKRENLDIVIEFERATIGIEGKIGHEVTLGQLEREWNHVDHLMVLVKEPEDVMIQDSSVPYQVISWDQLLEHYPTSRITAADINSVNDRSRIARRVLNALDVAEILPTTWTYNVRPGGSGYPGIEAYSPILDSGRQMIVQIEADRQNPSGSYLGNVGISVKPSDFSLDEPEAEPLWISLIKQMAPNLEATLAGTPAQISCGAGRGAKGFSKRKIELAKRFHLDLHRATGYTDSYIGVRTLKVGPDKLPELVKALLPAAVKIFEDELAN
ncbi:hypothetical protein [Glutamicibacter sp. AOP33-2CA-4]|uniref:hypothetical protein n=1 Tax=Glutamicibacter sp. AOP33-2CA-4 TaxID=3457690 RepID=UPI0040346A97